ncbi:MAG TPA: hypothetical protein VFS77_13405 [Pyrinomonadaceae bacterium]|nr:hypothetical protein [Pyrinomonadaceae bacterium]
MTRPNPTIDEEIFGNDVNYGIADCRRRLRARAHSRRSTLRAHNHPPTDRLDEQSPIRATQQLEEREEALLT